MLYLQSHKSPTATASGTIVPNTLTNPAITAAANDPNSSFAAGVKVTNVIYAGLQGSVATLATPYAITPTSPSRAVGAVIKAADAAAVYTDIVALGNKDQSATTAPWHHSHANHANHGNHASHFNALHNSTSDKKLKKNIESIKNALDMILKLSSATANYEWKEEITNARVFSGFIAQEVERVCPKWVIENKDGIKQIALGPLEIESILIKAIQEQQILIDQLREKIGL